MGAGVFITGTDTDAGKTVAAAALLRAMLLRGLAARAVKPVQTGCAEAGGRLLAPDVLRYREAAAGLPETSAAASAALHCFAPACSPHLAARAAGVRLSARELAAECRAQLERAEFTVFEGAGGLHAPLSPEDDMLDLMAQLGLPVLLVAGNRLGCLNHALLSLDALAARGLPVAGAVLCRTRAPGAGEEYLLEENARLLKMRCEARGCPLLCELPFQGEIDPAAWERLAAQLRPVAVLLASRPARVESTAPGMTHNMARSLDQAEVAAIDSAHLWHPYAPAEPAPRVWQAASASGTRIRLADGRELVDGMSSWWCAALGYGRPEMKAALRSQAEEMAHVMFGGFTHEPAARLAKRLVGLSGLERVFFADSGSVAVEVALKMALQFQMARGHSGRTRVAALRGAYHGDTLGAMSVCDPVTGMHRLFRGTLPAQLFLERPACRFDLPYDRAPFLRAEEALRASAAELAAVIVEPVVQGAGGMWFYHPSYLRDLRRLCDELDLLLIADEIATGFGRTGRLFGCEWAGVRPDIMCLGKAMTGGTLTFSAVLSTSEVAAGISRPRDGSVPAAFMHGPTYMANPLACAVACAAVDALLAFPWRENVLRIEGRLKSGLGPCRGLPGVRDVRVLGAIGVIETEQPVDTEKMQEFFVREGVWIRPFGRLVYAMPPFVSSDADVDSLTAAMRAAITQGLHL